MYSSMALAPEETVRRDTLAATQVWSETPEVCMSLGSSSVFADHLVSGMINGFMVVKIRSIREPDFPTEQ